MADENKYNIKIEAGTDFVLPFVWTDDNGTPVDLTGATVSAQLREYSGDPDAIDFICTHNNTGGRIMLVMPNELTRQITYSYGVYDVTVVLGSGVIKRPLYGEVKVQDEVTKPLDGEMLYTIAIESYNKLPVQGLTNRLYYVYAEQMILRWNGTNYVSALEEMTLHNEGVWDEDKEYQKFATVTNAGSSYLALQNVPVGIDIHNTTYWLKLAEAGGAENIDDDAGEGDTTITWSADKLNKAQMPYLNIANYTNGQALSSDNIATAIDNALEESSYLYIPSGTYKLNVVIEKDCNILMDPETVLYSLTRAPIIYAHDCSINIHGGEIYTGPNNTNRATLPEDPLWSGGKYTGAIHLESCHDCKISNIKVRYSNNYGAIFVTESTNVIIENICARDCLYSCVSLKEYNKNIIVRNNEFYNTRSGGDTYGWYWCYFVICSSNHDLYKDQDLADNIIYENNYCDGTEDSGLDIHGCRNGIIRNNVILNTVNAITAYPDNSRHNIEKNMYNILIENNYCHSNKQNNPNTTLPHPYLILGSPNNYDDPEQDITIGNYESYNNLVIRNNYFASGNDVDIIDLNRISGHIIIENNVFRVLNEQMTGAVIRFTGCIGFRLAYNTIYTSSRLIGIINSFGEVIGNVGSRFFFDNSKLTYVKGLDGSNYNEDTYCTVAKYGDRTPDFGVCNTYGLCYTNKYTGPTTLSISVSGNVATCNSHKLLPGIRFTLPGNIRCSVKRLLTVNTFEFAPSTTVADGDYTATLMQATFKDELRLAVTNGSVNCRALPNASGAIVGELNGAVICGSIKQNNYLSVMGISNGNLIKGYCASDLLQNFQDSINK